MPRISNPIDNIVEQLDANIATVEEAVASRRQETKDLLQQLKKLKTARRTFHQGASTDNAGRAAPTVRHVRQAMPKAFNGLDRLPEEQLSRRLIQILKAQDSLSEQGLTLRVQQGISRLSKDSSGFVLAPSAPANSEDKPAVN